MKGALTFFCCLIPCLIWGQNCSQGTAYDSLNINHVNARINSGGDLWGSLVNGAGYKVPASSGVAALFAGALWIGGYDGSGSLHMAAQTYRQNGTDYFPGPLNGQGQTTDPTCTNFDRLWKITAQEVQTFLQTPNPIPNSIKQWPGKGNPNLPWLPNQALAPFVDINGDGLYNPADGDYPSFPGDEAIWWVYNDAGNLHTETGGLPLGIEVQNMAYAFQSGDCLNDATFYHYYIQNKSANDYDSVYIGNWTDPDLGCFMDDNIGCDTANNMVMVYNADAFDESCGVPGYGANPPIVAIELLHTPLDAGQGAKMTNLMYYINDFSAVGNPEVAMDYYHYLRSIWKDGSHLTYGGNGTGGSTPSNFAFPGEPANAASWSMCSAGVSAFDAKWIQSNGPFHLGAGQSVCLDFAVVYDRTATSYPCPVYQFIRQQGACCKVYFDQLNLQCDGVPLGVALTKQPPLKLFPVPAPGGSLLTLQGPDVLSYRLLSADGRIWATAHGLPPGPVHISTGGVPSGIYLLQVQLLRGNTETLKLVIE